MMSRNDLGGDLLFEAPDNHRDPDGEGTDRGTH